MGERIEALKAALNLGAAALSRNPTNTVRERFRELFKSAWSEPPRRGTGQWIDLYMKSPRMNPAHKISTDVAIANYRLYTGNKKDKDTWEEVVSHPVLDLLDKPVPDKSFTGYHLMYLTQVYLLMPSGEAFWLVERNGLGMPTELWIVPPHWVMQTPTRASPAYKVILQGAGNGKQIDVPEHDMVWIKEPNPLNPYGRGRGRTEAIGDEIETDEYAAKYQKRFFFNDAVPNAVGYAPGADETEIERIKNRWNEKYQGYGQGNKMAWLPWDAKIQILKESNKEMDFVESRKFLRDTANQFWGIPPELFGILENSNRSTIDAAYYIYTKNTLSSRLTVLDEAITRQLTPMFDPRLFLVHDNVVPDDEEFKLKKDTEGLKYGAIMVDEWRTSQGKKVLPNKKGQMLYVPLNMTPYPLSGATLNVPNDSKNVKAFSDESKKTIWKNFDKTAASHEKAFEEAAKNYFTQQHKKLEQLFLRADKAHKDENEDFSALLAVLLLGVLAIFSKNENLLLADTLTPMWIGSMQDGFERSSTMYGFGQDAQGYAQLFRQWTRVHGLSRATDINDTTRAAIEATLTEGVNAGEGMPKLRSRVSAVYSDASKTRAMRIARTEAAGTLNYGTFESFKAAGVKQKEWLSTMDPRTRDAHSTLNGQIRMIEETFSNGLMYPGDASGAASEVVNCRCTLLPVIKEDD